MNEHEPNTSLGTRDPILLLGSPHVVFIDIDYFHEEITGLVRKRSPSLSNPRAVLAKWVQDLGPQLLAYHRLSRFHPGTYAFALSGIKRATKRALTQELSCFAIDSGALLIIDYSRLAKVARSLTRARYERYLSSDLGDDSVIAMVNRELGGPYFAIVNASADNPKTEFWGDGTYVIKSNSLRPQAERASTR